jgi:toxin-antitoxin system PIN domain toxin
VKLFDVNVLVYTFRQDADRHAEYRDWLLSVMSDDAAFAVSEQVLAAVLRLTTHPKIFKQPSRASDVFAFTDTLLGHASCRVVRPSASHWSVFQVLCTKARAKGNLVSDAWFAALALDSGCTWITTDRDYARFPGLRWRHPLDHERDIDNPA